MDSPLEGDGSPGLRIIRPIPRRPGNLSFTSPTPPDEDSAPTSPQISANDLRFLDPRYQQQQQRQTPDADSLSRVTSFMNLTSGALFGIYAPSSPGRDERADDLGTTPWGTGAETPAQPTNVDEATYKLMKTRSSKPRRASSFLPSASPPPPASRITHVSSLLLRAALLFFLGIGYGILVTRLPNRQNLFPSSSSSSSSSSSPPSTPQSYPPHYLTFWGIAGVALGSLLPWFDRIYDSTFSRPSPSARPNPKSPAPSPRAGAPPSEPEADWPLVIRSIGAFVGIAFAIRKLPWTSTMQVSLTLALANPFLWYLIDRSKPGFLLSSAVGVTGAAILMKLSPGLMPLPAAAAARGLGGGWRVGRGANGTQPGGSEGYGGWADQETVEVGMWMLSVLFCSCVCFGNIGRRLAIGGGEPGGGNRRGRWGGVR